MPHLVVEQITTVPLAEFMNHHRPLIRVCQQTTRVPARVAKCWWMCTNNSQVGGSPVQVTFMIRFVLGHNAS